MTPSEDLPILQLLLVSAESELPMWMLEDMGALLGPDGCHSVRVFGHELRFRSYVPDVSFSAEMKPHLLVGLVRFVDVLSLQRLDELYRSVSRSHAVPAGFLVYRNENEADFKMSCPYCGQKIWVRDADLDKRGRCPGCKKGFTLPQQEAHVTSALKLPETVPVRRITRGDPASLSGPLQAMLRLHKVPALAAF
jgi:predicted RNA-binding Zn-ribbon protein involved in translation (DUF1610 family)